MKLKPETLKRIKNNELLTIEQTSELMHYFKYRRAQGASDDDVDKELGIDKYQSLIVGNE
jgi:hypothetical protein